MNLISSLKIKQIENTCKRFEIASSISISISNCINNVHHETRGLTVFRIRFYFWPKSKLSSKFNIPSLTCSVWNKYYYYNFQRQFQHIKTMCGGRIVDTTLDGVGYSRSQHPRTAEDVPLSTQLEGTIWLFRVRVSSNQAFSVAAPRVWNGLPVDIRQITDTKLFKKKLKTFLFNSAYHGIRQWNFV